MQKKGKKGKKGKKEKDLTPDRTIESLYEELAREGVIIRCPKVRLSEFMGDYRYSCTVVCVCVSTDHLSPPVI